MHTAVMDDNPSTSCNSSRLDDLGKLIGHRRHAIRTSHLATCNLQREPVRLVSGLRVGGVHVLKSSSRTGAECNGVRPFILRKPIKV
jgi:hypothetical protein